MVVEVLAYSHGQLASLLWTCGGGGINGGGRWAKWSKSCSVYDRQESERKEPGTRSISSGRSCSDLLPPTGTHPLIMPSYEFIKP